jgi:hypothetical protein
MREAFFDLVNGKCVMARALVICAFHFVDMDDLVFGRRVFGLSCQSGRKASNFPSIH